MNLTIRDQPIFEDENQAKQAMDEIANTLRLVRRAVRHCEDREIDNPAASSTDRD